MLSINLRFILLMQCYALAMRLLWLCYANVKNCAKFLWRGHIYNACTRICETRTANCVDLTFFLTSDDINAHNAHKKKT